MAVEASHDGLGEILAAHQPFRRRLDGEIGSRGDARVNRREEGVTAAADNQDGNQPDAEHCNETFSHGRHYVGMILSAVFKITVILFGQRIQTSSYSQLVTKYQQM